MTNPPPPADDLETLKQRAESTHRAADGLPDYPQAVSDAAMYFQALEREIARLRQKLEEAKAALGLINAVRNSIIGTQTVNWSAHVYPLVAALDAAGYEGLGYDEARAEAATLLEQRDLAQSQRDALQAFKDFVHRRLDEAGVPTHPDGPHSKEGCRIGDRLDIVLRSAEHSWGMTLSADARAKQAEVQRDALAAEPTEAMIEAACRTYADDQYQGGWDRHDDEEKELVRVAMRKALRALASTRAQTQDHSNVK